MVQSLDFTIKADDPDGPEIIEYWAELYSYRLMKVGRFDAAAQAVYRKALLQAEEIRVWQATRTPATQSLKR